jgi:Ser/Thr protein kinase RdoA (MazF antagonist)
MAVLDDDPVQHDDSSEAEVALAGGNMSQVVRRGQAVHRTAGPWTATIHRLLDHLHANGVSWLPRPLGFDDQGREVLTYLPGTVPSYPMPAWVWSEDVLVSAGRRLAQVHQASAGFDTTSATWQLPPHDPAEVICLNDVAPYNMVFDEAHQLTGFIDVDTASPGPRAWDLAYLAYRLAPLSQFEDTGDGQPSITFRRARLELLCRAYAEAGDRTAVEASDVLQSTITRLEDLAAFTADRAAAGATHVADHVQGYRSDARWVSEHLDALLPTG